MVEALLSVSCEASHLPSVQTADLTGPARSPTEIHVSIHSWQRRHTVPIAVLGAALALGAAGPALASPGQATDSLRSSTLSAQSLAETIAGPAEVTNATFTGNDVQAGTFSGLPGDGNAVTDGVALTSGSLIDADPQADSDVDFTRSSVLGPNHDLTTTGDLGGAGDEALDSLSGADTYDAATLEFDVTATASTFVMFYGFGSEEYAGGASSAPDAWQSRGFKDVLSIQVNGTECATVPDSDASVNAATVNESSNSQFYTSNVSGHEPGSIDVEFNGFTSALACRTAVTPGEQVHVRIAIADTLDGQLDSTVLMRTGGLGFTDAPPTDPCTSTTSRLPSAVSSTIVGANAGTASTTTTATTDAARARLGPKLTAVTTAPGTAANAVTRRVPPRGAAVMKGPSVWLYPKADSGKPPNGNRCCTASNNTRAAGVSSHQPDQRLRKAASLGDTAATSINSSA